MNVAIIHQDKNIIKLLEFILADCDYNLIWKCANGEDALQYYQQQKPDLTLIQNHLNGLSCPKVITSMMKMVPTTIIVITESIANNPGSIFEAMSAGALDAIVEPHSKDLKLIAELKTKIQNIYSLQKRTASSESKRRQIKINKTTTAPLVAIGSSTGGPAALVKILTDLPINIPVSIVIIQHLDSQFSQGMAEWLNNQTKIQVKLACTGQKPIAGIAYLAATNNHLILNQLGLFEYTEDPKDYPYRPSVDVFFESVLKYGPSSVLGILLTGMGKDGASGLLSFHQRGIPTIAQNEESCAVYGMPKAAIECNAAKKVCDINDIAHEILEFIKGS